MAHVHYLILIIVIDERLVLVIIPKKIRMNHLVITDILAGILELKTLETKPTTNLWREPFSCLYCQGRFHPVEQVPCTMRLSYKGRYATRHTNEPVGRPCGRYNHLLEICRLNLSEHILIYARRDQIIRAIISLSLHWRVIVRIGTMPS